MKQEIVNAIAAYLENETHLSNKHGETFVQFKHPVKIGFNRAEYCQEIAQEIAAKIEPLLPQAVGWMEVPKGFTSTVKVERRPNDQTPSTIR